MGKNIGVPMMYVGSLVIIVASIANWTWNKMNIVDYMDLTGGALVTGTPSYVDVAGISYMEGQAAIAGGILMMVLAYFSQKKTNSQLSVIAIILGMCIGVLALVTILSLNARAATYQELQVVDGDNCGLFAVTIGALLEECPSYEGGIVLVQGGPYFLLAGAGIAWIGSILHVISGRRKTNTENPV